jgi:hypothetical protein
MNVSCYQSPTNPKIYCAEITTRNEIIEMFSLGIPHGFEFVNSSEKRDVNIQMIPGNSCIRLLFTRTKDIPEKDQITPYLSYQYNEKMTYIPPHENDEDDLDEEYRQQPYQYISTQHYFTLGVNTVISPIVDEVQKSNLI